MKYFFCVYVQIIALKYLHFSHWMLQRFSHSCTYNFKELSLFNKIQTDRRKFNPEKLSQVSIIKLYFLFIRFKISRLIYRGHYFFQSCLHGKKLVLIVS